MDRTRNHCVGPHATCRGLRRLAWAGGASVLLASCSPNVALLTPAQRLHREALACAMIGPAPTIPPKAPGATYVVGVKASLITALEDSGNASLEAAAQSLSLAAAKEENGTGNGRGMDRALLQGVAACRQLGLATR